MATTPYLELDDQATGANNNTWGDVADANFGFLELAIARFLSIATTGGTTTLTTAQNRYPVIRFTGVLASNATIEVRTAEKNWTIINATTGNFTLTVKTAAGTGKTVPRGSALKLYCDGTNVEYARAPGVPAAQAGGTVDAITAVFSPVTVSGDLQDNYLWIVEAAGANTSTTPTFNPDGTGALTIKKFGGQALVAGDIRGAGHKLLLSYDASGGHVELLNPQVSASASTTVVGMVELATTTEVLTGTAADRAVTPDSLAALWEWGGNNTGGATITIGEGGFHDLITSTATISAFNITTDNGVRTFRVRFNTIRTLTHSTTLKLPGEQNILTEVGDIAQFVSNGGGGTSVTCEWYTRKSGRPLLPPIVSLGSIDTSSGASASLGSLVLTSYKFLRLVVAGLSSSGTANFLIGNSTSDDVRFTADMNTAASTLNGIVEIDLVTGIGTCILQDGSDNVARAFDSAITTASTAISIAPSTGTLDAGSITVYGLR